VPVPAATISPAVTTIGTMRTPVQYAASRGSSPAVSRRRISVRKKTQ
jgi:hypothetical protein